MAGSRAVATRAAPNGEVVALTPGQQAKVDADAAAAAAARAAKAREAADWGYLADRARAFPAAIDGSRGDFDTAVLAALEAIVEALSTGDRTALDALSARLAQLRAAHPAPPR